MLDNNSLIVLAYLKNYFKTNSKPIHTPEILINGLGYQEIDAAIVTLDNAGYVNLGDKKYVQPPIESVNY